MRAVTLAWMMLSQGHGPVLLSLRDHERRKKWMEISTAFGDYLAGKRGPWLIAPDRLVGRLDAKYLLPWSVSALEPDWRTSGVAVDVLENLVDPVEETVSLDPSTSYTFLRISYEGRAEAGEKALGKEVSYSRICRARAGDIVVSNISAVYKAICVMPEGMGDVLVSNEFTVLRLKPNAKADPQYPWSVLRSFSGNRGMDVRIVRRGSPPGGLEPPSRAESSTNKI